MSESKKVKIITNFPDGYKDIDKRLIDKLCSAMVKYFDDHDLTCVIRLDITDKDEITVPMA